MNKETSTPETATYLHRTINAQFSLLLMEESDIQIGAKHKIDFEGGLSIEQAVVDVIQEAATNFLNACERLTMPADALAGDEPMIQLVLEYFHMREDVEENFTFSCVETVTIKPSELNRAIAGASNQAKALFARKLPALLAA
jgi:hypothetical protein